MGLMCRYVWLMVIVSFIRVNNFDCSAVTDFPQLDNVNTKYVCQNDSVNLSCPSPSLLEIQAASFGRSMRVVCASGANADRSCYLLDKKDIVKQMCDYKPECKFVANAENFGNDCPHVDKYLNVIYACVSNPDVEYFKTKATTIESSSTLPTQPLTFKATTIESSSTLLTQPLAFNPTTIESSSTLLTQSLVFNMTTLQSNVTLASNISMNNITSSIIQPLTSSKKARKIPKAPKTKVRKFNPDGPPLEFLAKAGQKSIFEVKIHTQVIILSALGTLTSLFH